MNYAWYGTQMYAILGLSRYMWMSVSEKGSQSKRFVISKSAPLLDQTLSCPVGPEDMQAAQSPAVRGEDEEAKPADVSMRSSRSH
jgi:hypothetical protein